MVTVAIRYMILAAWRFNNTDDRTIEEFFYDLKREVFNEMLDYALTLILDIMLESIRKTFNISGALVGAGAAIFYLSGIEQWMVSQTSIPAMGFNGIAAAFLGGTHPIGVIFSSYFIQHITSGGTYVDTTLYCSQISDLISAFIIYLCGFVLFFKVRFNRFLDKRARAKGGKE